METLETTLPKMKSPRDKRPSIWRQGVLQIHIIRSCDKSCFGCTQGSNLGGKSVMITPEQFDVACASLSDYWGVVGMFGGNPAMHPQFDELCKIMRARIPYEQRGLWCNHPRGKADHCRITFNPKVSNLNVHLDQEAYDEFARDWPECRGELKGLTQDSRHSPVYVAMKDVIEDESEIWDLIGKCDVNQYWSAMICSFRGELRGYFCEIAGAQSMLHQNEPDYPDLGVKIEPGWWDKSMDAFQEQVKYHCFSCGFPLKGKGELAITGTIEQVSKTHENIYKPKTKGREVQLVTLRSEVKEKALVRGTDYLENGVFK
jgi:hypothetical protein